MTREQAIVAVATVWADVEPWQREEIERSSIALVDALDRLLEEVAV